MRVRNPCFRLRRRELGWYVRFMVRYPRLGGRAATGKILDDMILRRSPSYPPPPAESAKFHEGPRNSMVVRETSYRPVSRRYQPFSHCWQFLPGLIAHARQRFPPSPGRIARALPLDFPVLPPASPHPYTRRRSWVLPPCFPGHHGSGRDGRGNGAWTEEQISPHLVDRYVDMRVRRKRGISGGRTRLVHRGVGDLPPAGSSTGDAGCVADVDRTARLER